MAVRDAIDADFNAASRYIVGKLDIYFDETPVTITHDDYLISTDVTEEASAESANPLGAISANELNFELYNDTGRFDPANTLGPYYGKIKTGVKVIPYVRPIDSVDTVNWIPLGVYYVAEWSAHVTGTVASVYALDNLADIFETKISSTALYEGVTFASFLGTVLTLLGYTNATVDSNLTTQILYAYIADNPTNTLQELLNGAAAICHSNRAGVVEVVGLTTARSLRATLTDADQIISVKLKQTTLKTYDGVSLSYVLPRISEDTMVLNVQGISVPNGVQTLDTMKFDYAPVKFINSIAIKNDSNTIVVSDADFSAYDAVIQLTNSSTTDSCDIEVYGTFIEYVRTNIVDTATKLLSIENTFIQTATAASSYKTLLDNYVACQIPVLELQIRGNPLLKINDKIRVTSTKYNLDFTGIIQRLKFSYAGALSCEMTLLNADIVEGGV